MEVAKGVLGMRADEQGEATGHLVRQGRGDPVHLAEEDVGAGIPGIEVRGVAEGAHGVVVLAARILRDAQSDREPRRPRIPLDGLHEHPTRRLEGAKPQQVVAPVEEVLLGGVHVGGLLELLRGLQQVARRLLGVPQQLAHVGGVAARQQAPDDRRRPGRLPGLQVAEGALQLQLDRGFVALRGVGGRRGCGRSYREGRGQEEP